MPKRFTFKKITTGEPATCYYCHKSNTFFALYDIRDRSETFTCPVCAVRIGKIKRLQAILKKYPLRERKSISGQNSLIKKMEDGVSTEEQRCK